MTTKLGQPWGAKSAGSRLSRDLVILQGLPNAAKPICCQILACHNTLLDMIIDTPNIKTQSRLGSQLLNLLCFFTWEIWMPRIPTTLFQACHWIGSKRPKGSGCSWWDQAWDTASTKSSCVGTRPWMTSHHAKSIMHVCTFMHYLKPFPTLRSGQAVNSWKSMKIQPLSKLATTARSLPSCLNISWSQQRARF